MVCFERYLFTRVLGIITSGFSGKRVLKLSELVSTISESSFSDPRVLKTSDIVLRTSESSFSESDCSITLPDAGCLYNLVLQPVLCSYKLASE